MNSLPIVTFILWSTGLSAFAVFGLALSDWHTERRASRLAFSKPLSRSTVENLVTASKSAIASTQQVESLPLAKAA